MQEYVQGFSSVNKANQIFIGLARHVCKSYLTIYLVTSLPNLPDMHRMNMVLANPTNLPTHSRVPSPLLPHSHDLNALLLWPHFYDLTLMASSAHTHTHTQTHTHTHLEDAQV
jgi:hypothetical protein